MGHIHLETVIFVKEEQQQFHTMRKQTQFFYSQPFLLTYFVSTYRLILSSTISRVMHVLGW